MKLEQWISTRMFRLPRKVILRIVGSSAPVMGSTPMDPHLQLAAWGAQGKRKLWTREPEDARRSTHKLFDMMGQPVEAGVHVQDLQIPSPQGHSIPARYYNTAQRDPQVPLLVYYHMGGGVVGDLDICHSFCSILAARSKGPVLSVGYRLAPQDPFPAGLEDAIAAYEWAVEQRHRFGVRHVAVGGDSMGGNFAAVISQEMKSQGKASPALQLLIYPPLDMAKSALDHEPWRNSFMLCSQMMQWFVSQYLPAEQERSDLRLSPGLCQDLRGLPPALVFTAAYDPLVEEGDDYATQLSNAGVPVVHRRFETMVHGFTGWVGVVPEAKKACEFIADQYRAHCQKTTSIQDQSSPTL